MTPILSLIIPANNEADHIGQCLDAVLMSDPLPAGDPLQIIVVPNGCSDETAQIARGFQAQAEARGWILDVVELEQGSKPAALNAGDATASASKLAYLDADVLISPQLLTQTADALGEDTALYVSGEVRLPQAQSWATRAYGAFYLQTPFMKQSAPGCGYFAMNRAGRARWGDWPAIISDDTFSRLNFAANERVQVDASYDWPLVEGLRNLIKVRRRQNAGVAELTEKYPELSNNDAKAKFTPKAVLKAVLRHPFGTLIYGIVSLSVKFTPGQTNDWRRGR